MTFLDYVKLIGAFLWWIPCMLFSLITKALTFPLALIIALPPFVVMLEESETTGYPSQFPGKPRAFLVKWLRDFQTFDDCLDAFFYSNRYKSTWLKRFSEDDFNNKWYVRYLFYVGWLWRNPAYGFARRVGFNQNGMETLLHIDQSDKYRKETNCSFIVVKNENGWVGWHCLGSWFYYKNRYFEYVLGWKIPWRNDPTNKAAVAIRMTPFRSK